jgi:PAS domain S-box-containing protein
MIDKSATPPVHDREVSLARRLALSLGVLNAVVIILAAAVCMLYVSSHTKNLLTDRTDRSLAYLGEALKSPLWSLDEDSALAVARGVLIDGGVGLLEIRDAKGEIWVSHDTGAQLLNVRNATIRHAGQVIGTMRFGLDASLRSRAIWTIAAFGCGAVIIVISLQLLFMSSLLHGVFRRPFRAMDSMILGLLKGDDENSARDAMQFMEFKPLVRTFLDMNRTMRGQLLELRESSQKYMAIFKHSPVGIFRTTVSGRLVEVNPACVGMFGYNDIQEFFADAQDSADFHYAAPAGRQRLLRALEASPEGVSLEIEMRRKDGSVFLAAFIASLEFGPDMRPVYVNGMLEDITERKRTERALAESEARFRNLFDTMPNGFYRSTPEGRFVDANPAFVKMLGYESLEELRGVYIPTDIYICESEREAIIDGNPEFTSQVEAYWLRRKDGKAIRVEDHARYVKDVSGKILFHEGICRDVTDRWEALEQLRQSEEKFSKLFRLSPDAVTLIGYGTGLVMDVNEAFTRITGYTREEAVGKTLAALKIFANQGDHGDIVDALAVRDTLRDRELLIRRKDGVAVECVVSCQMMTFDGLQCVLAVFHDVTEFKRMQQMMIQTEKMTSVGGIAAGVAHEINNPLGIIMNMAQNLAMRTRPDFPKNLKVANEIGLDMELLDRYMELRGLHGFIQSIQDAAQRAAHIIRHMLNFSRRSESRSTVCDLPSIVEKAIHLAGSDFDLIKEYDFKRIDIVREYEDDLPPIRCTETEIEQIFLNLLRNSAQAMAGGSPESGPRIVIRIRNVRTHLRVEVEDNGPGMPPDVQQRAFEPFFTTKPPGIGTGLGLSVSYFIVTRSHKGRMSLESGPGKGTRFIIELPVTDAEHAGEEALRPGV